MLNRWNVEFKKGFTVVCQNARGGTTEGIVSSIKNEQGRGKVVTLGFGMSFAADDVISAIAPLPKRQQLFFVEFTDTYGGEANYGWVHRFMVVASSMQGAISKVTKETGHPARKEYDTGDMARYNVPGAALCYFVSFSDGSEREQYSTIKEL
jgi:hypothetical protein